MEAAAIPVVKRDETELHQHTDQLQRLTGHHDNLLFGGHAAPRLDTPYHVTIKDNRDACHAISMMKVCQSSALSVGGLRASVNDGLSIKRSVYTGNVCPSNRPPLARCVVLTSHIHIIVT